MYWDLSSPDLAHALRQVVQGRQVIELGGADGALADVMVCDMMAESVLIVEKETAYRRQVEESPAHLVAYYWGYVQDFARTRLNLDRLWDVAVISFPPNVAAFDHGAIQVLQRSSMIVIIGKNDGVTAVGTSILWRYLVTRERTNYVVGQKNDLVVYGPNPRPPGQTLVNLELFGLSYDRSTCLTISQPLLPKTR